MSSTIIIVRHLIGRSRTLPYLWQEQAENLTARISSNLPLDISKGLILSSQSLRALNTAEHLADAIKLPMQKVYEISHGSIYPSFSVEDSYSAIHAWARHYDPLIVISHEPICVDLATYCRYEMMRHSADRPDFQSMGSAVIIRPDIYPTADTAWVYI